MNYLYVTESTFNFLHMSCAANFEAEGICFHSKDPIKFIIIMGDGSVDQQTIVFCQALY
jgi:hypothetical protein